MQVYALGEALVLDSKQGDPSGDPAGLNLQNAQNISCSFIVTSSLDFVRLIFVADDALQKAFSLSQ